MYVNVICSMNSLCDSYLTDDSLQELSEISDFFLTSVADNIKTEPADVIEQVGHVTVTSRALAVGYTAGQRCADFEFLSRVCPWVSARQHML